MADDLFFLLGETRRIRHEVTAALAFSILSVTADVYDSQDNRVVTAAVGTANSLEADNSSWEIYYLWTPAAVDDYRYDLFYTVGDQVHAERGRAVVWPATSKLDPYVARVQGWLQETEQGELLQQLSTPDYRAGLMFALDAYAADVPQPLSEDVPLTGGQWEYPLAGLPQFDTLWSQICDVEYPVDPTSPGRTFLSKSQYRLERDRAVWGLTTNPAAGQTARVHYTAPHLLTHTEDTTSPMDFEALCEYAAGALMAGDIGNLFTRSSDPQRGADIVSYKTKQTEAKQQGEALKMEGKAGWQRAPELRPEKLGTLPSFALAKPGPPLFWTGGRGR